MSKTQRITATAEHRILCLLDADDDRAVMYYHQARDAGRRWAWEEAEQALDRLYELVGELNPEGGYAWHRGAHPLQIEMR